jgi:hypothetical protein
MTPTAHLVMLAFSAAFMVATLAGLVFTLRRVLARLA